MTWARIAPEFNKATCTAGRLERDFLRDTLNSNKIAFIGAGNMANSLIRGLLAKGVPAGNIAACDVDFDPAEIDAKKLRGPFDLEAIAAEIGRAHV